MTDSVVRFNPDALAQDAKQEKNIMKSVAEDAVAASAISEAPVLEAQPKSQSPTLQASEKPASQSWFRLPFELPSFPWSKRLMVIVGGLFAIVGITALLFVRRFVRYLNSLGGGLPTPSTKPNQPRIIQEPSPAESVAPMQPRIEDKPMVSADAYLWPVAGTGTDGMSKPHEMRIQNKASAKSHFGRMLQAI
jgi:hypothetical protein